tara:strand:+ start:3938 stop:4516 length:579 start_codon:yes stop_codon:yes gene_type:complete
MALMLIYIHFTFATTCDTTDAKCEIPDDKKILVFLLEDVNCISAKSYYNTTHVCSIWREQMKQGGRNSVTCIQVNSATDKIMWDCSPAAIAVKYVKDPIHIEYKIHNMKTLDAYVTVPRILVLTIFETVILAILGAFACMFYIIIVSAFISNLDNRRNNIILTAFAMECFGRDSGRINRTYSFGSHLSRESR